MENARRFREGADLALHGGLRRRGNDEPRVGDVANHQCGGLAADFAHAATALERASPAISPKRPPAVIFSPTLGSAT